MSLARKGIILIALVMALSMPAACGPAATPTSAPTATPTAVPIPALTQAPTPTPKLADPEVILATTTSTADTGLLDVLLPDFQAETGYHVKPVAVGSGAAIAMGEKGDADVLLVHAPSLETPLMDKGVATARLLVMHNSFAIVGPASDPAKIRGMTAALDAFKKIADSKSLFVSRGDNSGTDVAEKALWTMVGVTLSGQSWYQESGQGMGATLGVASEKAGYTYTDWGTWLALKSKLQLSVMVTGDPVFLNIYHVMPVNPEKFPKVNAAGGKAFADYMVSPRAQALIKNYGVDRFGEPLFIPDAGKKEEDVGK